MKNFLLLVSLVAPGLCFAHGGGEEAARSTKGVVEYSEKEGFKLSEPAYKRFKIELAPLTKKSENTFSVPLNALVNALGEVNVYRVRDGHIKHADVKIIKKDSVNALIETSELKAEDKLVVKGADFLRVTEMDLGSDEHEDEHEEKHHD